MQHYYHNSSDDGHDPYYQNNQYAPSSRRQYSQDQAYTTPRRQQTYSNYPDYQIPPLLQDRSTSTQTSSSTPSHHAEPLYPPQQQQQPMTPLPLHRKPTQIRPTMLSPDHSAISAVKPFQASSVDLETIDTDYDDHADRSTHSASVPTLADKNLNDGLETGWKAALWPNSIACRLYLLAVMVETFIDLIIEGIVLLRLNDMTEAVQQNQTTNKDAVPSKQSREPVYLSIFALAHVLQMVLAVDAVYNKNTLQFLFLATFNLCLLLYGSIQIIEVQDNIKTLRNDDTTGAIQNSGIPIMALIIAVPVVIGIAEVAYIALGWRIWKEFGWKVYKFLGADRRIKKMYAHYQVFECLLKFDIFFYLGFSVQWLSLVLTNKDFEFWATVAALPLSLVLLVEGHLAARHESKWMMFSFMAGCMAGLAYFVYKAYRVYVGRTLPEFEHLWKSLLIFACVSIFLLLTTFASATFVLLNFGQGLKTSLDKKNNEHKLERRGTEYHTTLGRHPTINPKRMSIE